MPVANPEYFNTSHVVVYQYVKIHDCVVSNYFNTSHVVVYLITFLRS